MLCMTAPRKKAAKERAISVKIPEDLAARMDAFSDKHGRTVKSVVARAIEQYLDRNESKPPIDELE